MRLTFAAAIAALQTSLAGPLPGLDAQCRMAPRPRRAWRPGEVPPGVRHAAAALLLYPVDGRATTVLTLRADSLRSHASQVSLPGGRLEAGETAVGGALREAHEEVGADPAHLEPLGELTPLHIPVSGYLLHVVVAASPVRPDFQAHDGEVARVIEVDVARLADPSTHVLRHWTHEGTDVTVPGFVVDDVFVWGATAMVLAEFLALLACDVCPAG